ncbi:MAG TPA: ATP-binding protein [Bacteroidota bacterium]
MSSTKGIDNLPPDRGAKAQHSASVHRINAPRMLEQQVPSDLFKSRTLYEQLKTLAEIALHIDSANDFQGVLHVLRMETRWLVEHDLCFLNILNPSRTHYVIHSLSSRPDATGLHRQQFSLLQGLPGLVIQRQTPLVSNFADAPTFSDAVEGVLLQHNMQSIIVVPLRAADAILGSMVFCSSTKSKYNDLAMWIAQLLGQHVAVALRNTTLFEDARKRIAQIELVNQIGEHLTSTLKLEEVFVSAAERIQSSFSYYDVSIFMLNPNEKTLVLVAHSGANTEFLPNGYTQQLGEGIIGWVAGHAKRVLANDVLDDPRYSSFVDKRTRSELALPIIIEREVVGVLNIEDIRVQAFDTTDAVVLETLCDQLASAIRNARLFEQVKAANEKLTELDRMKSDFISIVSHDFRSPLASIILAAKGAVAQGEKINPARVDEHLKIIVEQATRLTHLAEDTLSTTKMESGRLAYQMEDLDTAYVVEEASSLVNLSRLHRVEVRIEEKAKTVYGDETKIRQVLHNLISNAVKYSPRGGKITIQAREQSSTMIVLSVSDEGVGIPPSQLNRLFQKFSRVTQESTREIKGSGLGLWICQEIVRAHGGEIWTESAPGTGSTFYFTLQKPKLLL